MAKPRITFVSRDRAKPYRMKIPWEPALLASIEQTAKNGQAVEYHPTDDTLTGARITQGLFNRFMRKGLKLHVRTVGKGCFLVWCERWRDA